MRPYIANDSSSPASILIDAPITYSKIDGAVPIVLPPDVTNADVLAVVVSANGQTLASGNVPLNASKYELSFSLASLRPQIEPYNITCTASYLNNGQKSSSAGISVKQFFPSFPPDSLFPPDIPNDSSGFQPGI